MAEGDGYIFNEFKRQMMIGGHNLAADDIKISLHGSGYTPNIDTDDLIADATDECAGTGYTAGGESITTKSVVNDAANDRAVFDGDDIVWVGLGALSPQPNTAVLYNGTNNLIIGYWEVTTLTNGGDYSLQFSGAPAAILLLS